MFVYKVLNQEVLDDRGKFEVSLWKNEFWKVEDKIIEDTFILLALSRVRSFLSCLWQRIWSAIHFRLRRLKPRRKRQVVQARRQNRVQIVRPPDRDGVHLVGGEKTGPNISEKYSRSSSKIFYRNRDERKVLPDLYTDHILYQLVWLPHAILLFALENCIYIYMLIFKRPLYIYIYIHSFVKKK